MATYPHCNADVIHAPGTCVFCDEHPERQRVRAAGGTPFTPAESNRWYGNTARPAATSTLPATLGPVLQLGTSPIQYRVAVHCPRCSSWTRTYVQNLAGEHRCAGCGGVMETYLAYGTTD